MKLIKDLGILDVGTKQPIRFGIYECPFCKKEFKARTANIKSGNTKSCGCQKYKTPDKYRQTTMYSSWDHMKQRCLNPKNSNYNYYGERGITICAEWRSFEKFKRWALKNGWKNGLTIDRIDPDGNYEPSNCRWTTQIVQNRNTRILKAQNKTGYRGVYEVILKSGKKRYRSEIMVDKVKINLGRYDTKEEAAIAYNNYIINNNLEHTINTFTN